MIEKILGIDPGPEESAFVVLSSGRIVEKDKASNDQLIGWLRNMAVNCDLCVIEMVASYGMPVGKEIFETVLWTGRFDQAWFQQRPLHLNVQTRPWLMPRMEVKMNLCGSSRAKDPNIRQALIDRYGKDKATAIGTKATPGPLYGVKADIWSALAVAVTAWDKVKDV